ncbi:NAD(P)H-flavin reductase [Ferrimonas aestuarii]|uniref:NAD(P)H-flavin reductase n=1 Tax=Ferrimonas aestuarii TaxID=2569539 RepID=A0A4U1BRQ2_9GAMM|nr:NAD(P)H-flavin reductase [Ferrimonas aestuarii]TKB56109.1 NAD(P)H-flavin reductase [Ferrimonas aestuarii]
MTRISCKIASVTPFCDTVFKVCLTPPQAIQFQGGQYLTIVMGEQDKRPFSIASGPDRNHEIELHIGAAVAEGYAMEVIERLKSSDSIEVELPFGDAQVRLDSQRPRILIAGGTGFSYINSIMEALIAAGDTQTTFLYWGSRDNDAMYLKQRAQQWANEHAHLHFIPVFEAEASERQGTVIDAVCEDFVSLKDYDVYIAGRFEMAGAAREAFRQKGINEDHLFGDAFAYIK